LKIFTPCVQAGRAPPVSWLRPASCFQKDSQKEIADRDGRNLRPPRTGSIGLLISSVLDRPRPSVVSARPGF
jgi:hypothetical protein